MADTVRCRKCGKEFVIPEKSTESAGDWENYSKWAIEDIKCPNCGTVVYTEGSEIDGWQAGGY